MLPKRQFIETVAALRRINPEDGGLEERGFTISVATKRELLRRLTGLLERPQDGKSAIGPMAFTNTVYTLIIEVYLETDSERRAGHRLGASSTCIVRRAEERFLAAQEGTVSLAMTSALGRQKPHTTHSEAVNRNSRLA